jgi:hypothetical protein
MLEHKHKLVLAAVERTHPGIIFDPDAQVLRLAIGGPTGGQQLLDVAPVHADEMDGAGNAKRRQVAESLAEKGREFGTVHLARSHQEGAMVGGAEAARMAFDRHVIGRIGEPHRRLFFAHQSREGRSFQGTAA